MSGKISSTVSVERLLGDELASAAGRTLADARLEAAGAVRLATAQVLLALYWELRHQRPEGLPGDPMPGWSGDVTMEWASALLCAPAEPDLECFPVP